MPVHPDLTNLFGLTQYDGCALLPSACCYISSHCPHASAHVMQAAYWSSPACMGCGPSPHSGRCLPLCRKDSFFEGGAYLSTAAGYAIVVGFGARSEHAVHARMHCAVKACMCSMSSDPANCTVHAVVTLLAACA